jgi:hypothetical protein
MECNSTLTLSTHSEGLGAATPRKVSNSTVGEKKIDLKNRKTLKIH